MRLVPASQTAPSEWDDWWEEKPGLPAWEGVWRRDPDEGKTLPEFEFEEGHERNRNDPPHRFLIGSWEHSHIRLKDARIPRRHVLLFKHGCHWYLERLDPNEAVYCNDQQLVVGKWHQLQHGDEFSLLRPPTYMTYRIHLDEEANWYLALDREGNWQQNFDGEWYLRECPSLYPMKMQWPPTVYPTAPEDLKRLAWQTDQMRRRSEENEVRVGDWAAFARHVKAHYLWYGMEAKPFKGTVCEPREQPPPRPHRGLPDWIADIVSKERQVAGVTTPLSFEEALKLSGREASKPVELQGPAAASARPSKGAPLGKGAKLGKGEPLSRDEPSGKGEASGKGSPLKGAPVAAAEPVSHKGAGTPAGKGRGKVPHAAPPVQASGLDRDLRSWLEELDESGTLLTYEAVIAEKFGDLRGLHAKMVSPEGALSKEFFEAVGVKKLGHKRTFEKFFKESVAT